MLFLTPHNNTLNNTGNNIMEIQFDILDIPFKVTEVSSMENATGCGEPRFIQMPIKRLSEANPNDHRLFADLWDLHRNGTLSRSEAERLFNADLSAWA
jgi:hypothetical protein